MLFFPNPTLFILLLLFLITFNKSNGRSSNNYTSSCPSSSTCGHTTHIRPPFRLKSDHCYYGLGDSPDFRLDCQDNQTVLSIETKRYFVQEFNYTEQTIRLVDPGIRKGSLSSCPLYSYRPVWSSFKSYIKRFIFHKYTVFSLEIQQSVAFIHCMSPVNSVKYVKAPFCGNRSNIFANSSVFYSYVIVEETEYALFEDLEESCTVDKVAWVSADGAVKDKSSLTSIYDGLAYGVKWQWITGNTCEELLSELPMDILYSTVYAIGDVAPFISTCKLVIGFPLLMWLVVHKWRRRHLSSDKTIEVFLQDQHNFAPIKYTYSEIKKMTNNFSQKLGEGGCGTVYKGKLRSGPYVAIKMMEQSMATEEEFINEVGSIGRIHHVNVVQLIGFCVKRSKYALVYEFLPNGSLDRYIFNQPSLGVLGLTFNKMLEIALGVARGIGYLHHGCDMQILHFDIKPHNILLDEKFNPKISDFGLARLHSTDESFISLKSARGTMGYMAPEMFYKNFGGISYKVDVYSFGMMLMEMVSKRKNMNQYVEDMSQMCFPTWVYNQLCIGKDIDIEDATEEEKLIVKKIIIVALWCIQMRPSDRPTMNKVAEMLEGDLEPRMPPKPFVAPHEIAVDDHGRTTTYIAELDLSEN